MNFCPYYDVSNESYARLNAMIVIMDERHKHFISEMRECGLLHETNSSLPFLIFEASLYVDYESSHALESNFGDNASLIYLEEAFDPR